MIRVQVTITEDAQWLDWRRRAQEATKTLIEQVNRGETPEISDLYKELKSRYLELFCGKCAYCETPLGAGQPGDIDHFRPKKRVRDAAGKRVVVRGPDGTERPHPGYYWLAYEWLNLLPTCANCNRPRRISTGQRFGKSDIFPVDGLRALAPGEETREKPLLLNPLDPATDPVEHFTWDETGVVGARTEIGRKCIDVLGLNRDGLLEERRRTFADVVIKFKAFVSAVVNRSPDVDQYQAALAGYERGVAPYSAIGRVALRKARDEFLRVGGSMLSGTGAHQ